MIDVCSYNSSCVNKIKYLHQPVSVACDCFRFMKISEVCKGENIPSQLITYSKEPSIKDVRSQGVGLSSEDKGGSSDADIRTFWCKKLRIFRNLWRVRTDKGSWATADIFRTRGAQLFAILCGRPRSKYKSCKRENLKQKCPTFNQLCKHYDVVSFCLL